MRRAAAFALAASFAAAAAGATEIRAYAVRLELAADGSATADATVQLAGASAGTFELPLGFAAGEALRLTTAPPGTTVQVLPRDGRLTLRFDLPPGLPPDLALGFRCAVPGATGGEPRRFRHALLNAGPTALGGYALEVLLPEAWRVHALREALPRLRPGEPGPRAELRGIAGRRGARLAVDGLAPGETAGVELELEPAGRSPAWWVGGAVLAALYLVGFRDLVTVRKARPGGDDA